jgi:hypothetical protein
MHRAAISAFAVAFMGIGFAMLVVTTIHGGGVVGYVLGLLFIAAGAGRLYLVRRR